MHEDPELVARLARRLRSIEVQRLPTSVREMLYGVRKVQEIDWDRVQLTQAQVEVARECLRQMEYAWAQGYTAAECREVQAQYVHGYFDRQLRAEIAMDWVDGKPVRFPLTLAPEDWKP